MCTEFDVQLKEQDLYRFQLINAYRGTQGWASVVLALVALAMYIVKFGQIPMGYSIMYLAFAVVFLLYVPVTLFVQAKSQYHRTAVFHEVMHYEMSSDGLLLKAGEEEALLPWNMVYKAITTRDYLLIYSGRANAYIVPLRDISDKRADIKSTLNEHIEEFRLKVKKL